MLWISLLLLLGLIPTARAQDAPAKPEPDLVAKVRAGGVLHMPQWRRSDDGALEVWLFLGKFGREDGFERLLRNLGSGLLNAGACGPLVLWLQGGGDLLAQTDVDLHFGAVGIDTSDVGLRQHLMQPASFAGARGRAELLDRLLILDLLERRGCEAARAEALGLARQADLPAALRARARQVAETLAGTPTPLQRRRLAAEDLRFPPRHDLSIVIDHARLPDMRRVAAVGRLMAAGAHAKPLTNPDTADLCWAQRWSDVVGELPFEFVLRVANMRLDHSCTSVNVSQRENPPFRVWYQAVGAFEVDAWPAASPYENSDMSRVLPRGEMTMTADTLRGHNGADAGIVNRDLATKLLADTESAIRVLIPQRSAIAEFASAAGLTLRTADVRITFPDHSIRLTVQIDAGEPAAATAWVDRTKALLAQGQALLKTADGQALMRNKSLAAACQALLAADLEVAGTGARTSVEIPFPDVDGWITLAAGTGMR